MGPARGSPIWLAAADYDRDTRMDLAALVISDAGYSLRILRGKGDVTFIVGPSTILSRELAHFDGDGTVDVLASCFFDACDGEISIGAYVTRGTARSWGRTPTRRSERRSPLSAADFTGDGKPDFVALSPGSPVPGVGFYVNVTDTS